MKLLHQVQNKIQITSLGAYKMSIIFMISGDMHEGQERVIHGIHRN